MNEKRCVKRVYGPGASFRGSQCSKPPKLFEADAWWCKVHAPSMVNAKIAARDVRWAAERKAREAQYAISDARDAVVDVAKGWAADPDSVMNQRALKSTVDALLAAENKAKV